MESTDYSFANTAEFESRTSTDALFSSLYSELHRLAKREKARQWNSVNLGATTLLHEAYIDMAKREDRAFPDHARFIGYIVRVIRGLIIDHSRRNQSIKRGGEFEITSLEIDRVGNAVGSKDLSRIGDALDQLALVEPELAEVVDLKFFCGFSFAEIAALQKLSERTVQRRWEKARIFLRSNLGPGLPL